MVQSLTDVGSAAHVKPKTRSLWISQIGKWGRKLDVAESRELTLMDWSPRKSTVTFETSWGLHLCLNPCDPDAVAGEAGISAQRCTCTCSMPRKRRRSRSRGSWRCGESGCCATPAPPPARGSAVMRKVYRGAWSLAPTFRGQGIWLQLHFPFSLQMSPATSANPEPYKQRNLGKHSSG